MTASSLDKIEAVARATHTAYAGIHPTREIYRWFDKLFAAIAEARGASSPTVNPSAPPVKIAEPVLGSDHVTCARCLSKRADRGHVEQHGVCLDCALGGHATKGPTVRAAHDAAPAAEREPPPATPPTSANEPSRDAAP